MSEEDYKLAEKANQRRARQMNHCCICGETIVGKAFRMSEGKYACNRCNNETSNQQGGQVIGFEDGFEHGFERHPE